MMSRSKRLVSGCLLAFLASSCADATDGDQRSAVIGRQAAIMECRRNPIEASRVQGLQEQVITRALQGDEKAAWDLLSGLLAAGQKKPADSTIGCLTVFWAEVAAQNGSLPAAYEIAIYEGPEPYICHRSKFWATKALSRIDEFRSLVFPDAPIVEVDAMIALRRDQLAAAAAKACPDEGAPGQSVTAR